MIYGTHPGHPISTTSTDDLSHTVSWKGLDALGRLYENNPDSGFWVRVVDYPAEDRLPAITRLCVALGEVTYPIRSRDASLTQEATA